MLADEPSLRGQQEEDGGEGGSEGEVLPENEGEKVLHMREEGQAAQAREAAASPSKDDRRWQMSDLLRSACFTVKKFLTLALDPHDGCVLPTPPLQSCPNVHHFCHYAACHRCSTPMPPTSQ